MRRKGVKRKSARDQQKIIGRRVHHKDRQSWLIRRRRNGKIGAAMATPIIGKRQVGDRGEGATGIVTADKGTGPVMEEGNKGTEKRSARLVKGTLKILTVWATNSKPAIQTGNIAVRGKREERGGREKPASSAFRPSEERKQQTKKGRRRY